MGAAGTSTLGHVPNTHAQYDGDSKHSYNGYKIQHCLISHLFFDLHIGQALVDSYAPIWLYELFFKSILSTILVGSKRLAKSIICVGTVTP